jgi:hypothetical protein
MKKGIVIVVLILCLAVGIYWAMDSQMFEKWLDMPDTKEESGENLYENEIGETQLFVWQPAEVYEGKDSLNEHLQYYYGILSADEQQIYGEIYTIMSEHSDYTKISTTDNSTIEKMMRYVLLDNPGGISVRCS